ncbi:MAG: hypothetical protein GWM87_00550 [Xanthomonadales bacterium]|nr:hypothetical protein [Xanthomonadales bacterium]NIX11594.1 hypothetical protein [Xanthomonadales bacterium]
MSQSALVIVSGGQTGVDRGALDAAIECGSPCRGWCPAGRRAEDGPIPAKYPLRELGSADYADRTRANVRDSDGTLVLSFSRYGPGTQLTADHARRLNRPLLNLDAEATEVASAIDTILEFIARHRIGVLNVAGPRASEAPGAQAFARAVVTGILRA